LDPLKWAVVRELNASGYLSHLPQVTWVNYRLGRVEEHAGEREDKSR